MKLSGEILQYLSYEMGTRSYMIVRVIMKVLCTSMYERRQERRGDVCVRRRAESGVAMHLSTVIKIRGVFQLLL